jgi:hypothetical protein
MIDFTTRSTTAGSCWTNFLVLMIDAFVISISLTPRGYQKEYIPFFRVQRKWGREQGRVHDA